MMEDYTSRSLETRPLLQWDEHTAAGLRRCAASDGQYAQTLLYSTALYRVGPVGGGTMPAGRQKTANQP